MFGTTRILSFAIILLLTSFNALAGAGGGGVGPPPPPPKPTLNNVAATINEDTNKYLNPGINGQGRGITGRRINSQPANGSASWSGNNLYFKPKANWCGRTTFRYSVATSAGWSSTRTATMTVRCVVDKPWVGNKNGTVQEDSSITLSPGISLDGGTISARYIDTQPRNGSVHWSGNRLIYTPKGNYCGSDSFRYSLRTQAGKSNVATSSITVACVVDIPIVGDVSGSLDEDTSKILSPSIFTDGAPITKYIIKAAALRGTATWNGNSLKYVPRENFCGTDTFTYQIQTSGGLSNAGTASLTVNCIVDKPTIDDVVAEFNEDTPYTFNPTIWTDGAAITQRTVDQAPSNGSLVWVGNNIKYTPNSNYCGSDTFKYSVSTSAGKSDLGNGHVTVKCVIDKPIISAENGSVVEDNSLSLTPTLAIDGGFISQYNIEENPSNGSTRWDNGSLVYTPNANYCGSDTFTYSITTQGGKSNVARSNISVSCVDDVPTLGNVNITLNEDSSKRVSPSIWTDNLAITAKVIDQHPAHGTASWDGNQVKYTPNANYCGADSFNYSITTRAGTSEVRNATVNVTCVIDKPVVSNKVISTLEDTPITFTPSVNSDGANITGRNIGAAPSNGNASIVGGSIKYTPNLNWCGTDTFTYRVSNSAGWSKPASFTVNVTCVDDVPTLSDVSLSVTEDTPKTVTPTMWSDGLAITQFMIDGQAKHGNVIWSSSKLTYSPDANYCGTDSFTYSIKTSAGTSQVKTGSVNVACVVDAAVLGNVNGTLDEDSSITKTPTVSLDGGTITKRDITKSATNGIATWESGKIKYVPNANFCGVETFKYRITTEAGYSNIATATFNVTCKQDIPTITGPSSINLSVLDTQSVVFNANDVDGDTLTAKLTTAGKNSLPSWVQYTFDGSKANVTFSPSEDNPGDYRFELTVDDGNSGMKIHDIRVNVRDNRPVTLTTILMRTFSMPQVFNDKEDNSLNGIHFENVKDSAGNLLTGTITVTVTVDASVTVPVIILGKNMQPGLPTPASYTFVEPGVIDISAIPSIAGQDGLIEFKIQFNVN